MLYKKAKPKPRKSYPKVVKTVDQSPAWIIVGPQGTNTHVGAIKKGRDQDSGALEFREAGVDRLLIRLLVTISDPMFSLRNILLAKCLRPGMAQ